MAYSDGLSASDVALLTNDNNRNNSWGDGGSWWIIVFLIFAFLGWGRNGFNGNGNDSNTYIQLAKAWLEDIDVAEGKAWRYYQKVVKSY